MAKGKSKTSKKLTTKKAKAIVTKIHKRKAKKNMDTFFFKATASVTITPKQGVTVANYIYSQFALMDSSASYGVTQNAEFNLYRQLYDKVRINSIKVRIVPKANMLTQVEAQNENQLNVQGSGMYYTAIDRDGQAPSNVAAIIRYPSVRRTNVLKPVTRTYKITWPTSVWLDTASIYSEQDMLQRMGCFGGVTLYGENVLEENLELFNEPFAAVELEWNCVFQGKTSASLSLAEDGSVCVKAHDTITNLEQSDVTPIYGPFVNKTKDESGTTVSLTDRGDHTTA